VSVEPSRKFAPSVESNTLKNLRAQEARQAIYDRNFSVLPCKIKLQPLNKYFETLRFS
jgi:hypothetical protein